MAEEGEQVVDPAFALRTARTFLAVTQASQEPDAQEEQGSQEDGWEAAGCVLWDIAAIPEQAELLASHHIMEILQTLVADSVAKERWRALEISLGILANLACHKPIRLALLGSRELAELVVERALWVDDTPALGEGCRLLAGLCLSTTRQDQWWQLMTAPEGLGRIAWMVDNTLSAALLEKALSLVCAMLQAAGNELPTLTNALLELGILSTAEAVLGSYLRQLEREQREFQAEGEEGSDGCGGGSDGEHAGGPGSAGAAGLPGAQVGSGGEGDGSGAAAPADEGAIDAAGVAAAARGPEISEAIALEAMSLVDGLTADNSGSVAVSAAEGLVSTVVQLLALSESDPLRLVCLTLLASLDDAGERLAASPVAVRAALAVLAGVRAGAAATPAEVQAGWALLAAAVHAVAKQEEGGEGGALGPNAAALLEAATDYSEVLVGEWEAAAGGEDGAAAQQQLYCLRRLQPLLERHGTGAEAGLPDEQKTLAEALAARLAQSSGDVGKAADA